MVPRGLVLKDLFGQHLGLDCGGIVVEIAHSDGHVGRGCVQWVRVLSNDCQVEELLVGLFIVHLLCNNKAHFDDKGNKDKLMIMMVIFKRLSYINIHQYITSVAHTPPPPPISSIHIHRDYRNFCSNRCSTISFV